MKLLESSKDRGVHSDTLLKKTLESISLERKRAYNEDEDRSSEEIARRMSAPKMERLTIEVQEN